MKQINLEFEIFFKVWEHVKTSTRTGYEDDYSGSTAKQYSDYVYNDIRWKGSNDKGQGAREVVEIFKNWLKETYPRYTFSVRRIHYKPIHIDLIKSLNSCSYLYKDFTDDWQSFVTVFKEDDHIIGKANTVGIEGNNSRLRHRIRRVFRKTCCFSKKMKTGNDINHFWRRYQFYLTTGKRNRGTKVVSRNSRSCFGTSKSLTGK